MSVEQINPIDNKEIWKIDLNQKDPILALENKKEALKGKIKEWNEFLEEGVIKLKAICERNSEAMKMFCEHPVNWILSFDITKNLLPKNEKES